MTLSFNYLTGSASRGGDVDYEDSDNVDEIDDEDN